MYRPVVSIIRAFNCNKHGSASANAEYFKYIVSRPGVDLSIEDSIRQDERTELNDSAYFQYINERPGSSGWFGNIDMDTSDVQSEIYQQSKKQNVIYRGILSLHPQDASELGFYEKKKWHALLDKTMPDIANQFNIPIERLRWVAAFHVEENHPHVHYMFYDSEPEKKVNSSFIHVSKQNKCRGIFSAEVFYEERQEIVKTKTAERDLMIKYGKNIMEEITTELNQQNTMELKSMPSKVSTDEVNSLIPHIKKLVASLPSSGSIKFAYMPPEVKKQVNDIVDMILQRPDIKAEYESFINNTRRIYELYSKNYTEKWIVQNANKDLRTRLGNMVLKTAKQLRKDNIDIPFSQLDTRIVDSPANATPEHDIGVTGPTPTPNEMDNVYPDSDSHHSHRHGRNKENEFWNKLFSPRYKLGCEYFYGSDKFEQNFEQAYQIFQEEAQKGNPLALYNLGTMHKNKLGLPYDEDHANSYYKQSFDSFCKLETEYHEPYLQFKIGRMYESGIGTDPNTEKAVEMYQLGANQGYGMSLYSLASCYYYGKGVEKNYEKAFDLFSESCKPTQGKAHKYADYEVARMYEKGLGTKQNLIKANEHYEIALESFLKLEKEQPDGSLLYRIGKMYLDGKGTEADEVKAVEYLENAKMLHNEYAICELGKIYSNPNSQYYDLQKAISYLKEAVNNFENVNALRALGRLYSNPKLDCYNIDDAVKLLKVAVENENEYAQLDLARIYSRPDTKYYDLKQAFQIFNQFSTDGNVSAQYMLGSLFYQSEHKNIVLAEYWLKEAATNGSDSAWSMLGRIYSDKELNVFDIGKALNCYEKIYYTDQGQYHMGKIMVNDNYVEYYNPKKGMQLLHQAAESGNSYAEFEIGKQYLYGKCIEKNKALAYQWIDKAISHGNEYAAQFKETSMQYEENYRHVMFVNGTYRLIFNMMRTLTNNNENAKKQLLEINHTRKRQRKYSKNHNSNDNQ